MLAFPVRRKLVWVIAIAISVISAIGISWVYWKLRTAPNEVIIPLTVSQKYDAIYRHLARCELERRISSGAADGTDALFQILVLAYSSHFDADLATAYADHLLKLGVDVNSTASPWGTPLHRAIAMNDATIVTYLLERCADPGVPMELDKDSNRGVDALEMAFFVEKEYPDRDYSQVIEVLESREIRSRCVTPRK